MPGKKTEMFRMIPAVARLLEEPDLKDVSKTYPRNLILRAINEVLDELREVIERGDIDDPSVLGIEPVSRLVKKRLELLARSSLRQVINRTGGVIHTNLGRSILAERVFK